MTVCQLMRRKCRIFFDTGWSRKKIPRAPAGNVGVSMSAAPGAERGSVAEIVSFLPLFTEDRRWAESQAGRLSPRGKGKGLGVCQHTSIPVYNHKPWIPNDQQTARNHMAVGKLPLLPLNTTLHATLVRQQHDRMPAMPACLPADF